MRPYGQRMGIIDGQRKLTERQSRANKTDGRRECVESLHRNHSETCPCRWPEDTEATMRRVMDKWLRGS